MDPCHSKSARKHACSFPRSDKAIAPNVGPFSRLRIDHLTSCLRYSALKMDGKPLYEYAREGKTLPRPIETRDANVLELELLDWQEARAPDAEEGAPGHSYAWPTKQLTPEQLVQAEKVKNLIVKAEAERPSDEAAVTAPLLGEQTIPPIPEPPSSEQRPPIFTLKMTVSSGTYVRSIVHDIGLALGSAAHVVLLTRTRQGDFALDEGEQEGNCVPWSVFEKALQDRENGVAGSALGAIADESKRAEWEKIVLSKWHD